MVPQWAKCAQQAQHFEDAQHVVAAANEQGYKHVKYGQHHQGAVQYIPSTLAVAVLPNQETGGQNLV